ncbi:MAG: heterodisulfide reductase-related iron-sulfur binding cluster [Syntrophales bacterium]|nr:heterodisulfide reductase-related iron-sulfur binding cluster [Syntrophales bacterium]
MPLRGDEMEQTRPSKVALFTGCTVNFIDPGIGLDTLAVFRHNGVEVLYPEQKCCGVPLLAYGNSRGFNRKAAFNLVSLEDTGCDTITPCTSCAHALKEEYPALVADPRAKRMAARTYDIMEYLVLMQRRSLLNRGFQRLDLHVLYHAPCHLKCLGQDLIDGRLRLLQLIPGIRLERIDHGCCGMGGTFGMKKRNYAISVSIGSALAVGIWEVNPDMVITECPGCKIQIGHTTGANVQHPIHVLRLAYGL